MNIQLAYEHARPWAHNGPLRASADASRGAEADGRSRRALLLLLSVAAAAAVGSPSVAGRVATPGGGSATPAASGCASSLDT